MEFVNKTFESAFDNFRKTTEATVNMQQELFRQWSSFWPPFVKPKQTEQLQQIKKEWSEAVAELTRKYLESWDQQAKASMATIEKAIQLAQSKDQEAFRQNVMELWQKSFECLKNAAEIQVQTFQASVEKWFELVKKVKP